MSFDRGDQATIGAIDTRHMADDFRYAHVGNVFGADDAIEAGVFHLLAAESEACRVRMTVAQLGDELRAGVVAAGFAG